MKKFKKFLSLLLVVGIVATFAACANNSDNTSTTDAPKTTTNSASTTKANESITQKLDIENPLYIGYDASGYKQYASNIDGEVTPEKLIEAIANLTGWNLKLADIVTTGKGGMTVVFSKDSFVKIGPPENQKEEFFVYDNFTFTAQVLDSIKKTLQMNFITGEGNPDNLDVYFSVEDEPIVVENVKIPIDKPWNSDILK